MRHYVKVEVPARVETRYVKTTCDVCNCVIESERFEIDFVEIRHKEGTNYPEGGSGTETEVDMCGKCFEEKLVPWLREQGVEPRVREWNT